MKLNKWEGKMNKYFRLLVLLLVSTLFVPLSSCGEKKNGEVKITIPKSQKEITLFLGGEAVKIQASAKPSAKLTFISENPKIATVNEKGLVKPVAEGRTVIRIEAAKAKPVSIMVEVLDLPTVPSVESKLPVLRFFFTDQSEMVDVVADHEQSCGRTPTQINVAGQTFYGFQNTEDDFVTSVTYDMKFKSGRESRIMVTCPAKKADLVDRIDRELRKVAFGSMSEVDRKPFPPSSSFWRRPDGITAYYFDLPMPDLKGQSILFLIKEREAE